MDQWGEGGEEVIVISLPRGHLFTSLILLCGRRITFSTTHRVTEKTQYLSQPLAPNRLCTQNTGGLLVTTVRGRASSRGKERQQHGPCVCVSVCSPRWSTLHWHTSQAPLVGKSVDPPQRHHVSGTRGCDVNNSHSHSHSPKGGGKGRSGRGRGTGALIPPKSSWSSFPRYLGGCEICIYSSVGEIWAKNKPVLIRDEVGWGAHACHTINKSKPSPTAAICRSRSSLQFYQRGEREEGFQVHAHPSNMIIPMFLYAFKSVQLAKGVRSEDQNHLKKQSHNTRTVKHKNNTSTWFCAQNGKERTEESITHMSECRSGQLHLTH